MAFEDAIENIDIGGPSMLRSAAKNHTQVIVIADPLDYPIVLAAAARRRGDPGSAPRARRQGVRAPVGLRRRDRALPDPDGGGAAGPARACRWSGSCRCATARTRDSAPRSTSPRSRAASATCAQRQGKELSFNNLLDIDAAMCGGVVLEHPRRLLHREAHDAVRHRRSASRRRRRSTRARASDPCRRSAASWRSTPW